LGCGTFSGQQTAFDELLAPHEPQPIQEAVVKLLGRFSDTAVVELLLRKWSGLTPGLRSSAAEVLLARPEWAESLLSAVEKNEIPAGDFDPARVALLQSHPLAKVRKRAAAVFANSSVARRADVVARYQRSLELEGDVERGRAVFAKSCAACHKLEGKGTEVGADLGGVRQRGAAGVLLNILDPNREILPKFLTYAVVTSDGRIFTGLIAKETSNDLSIRQPDGHEVPIKRRDIEEMASTGLSYMPEGLESQIDHQAMADLIAYLMATPSTPQTPGTME
jgi:putative heme-binding domain-containing protein